MSKVWFITGASKGLGLTLSKKLLKAGHKVAATSRDKEALAKAVGVDGEDFLPLEMDLTSNEDVKKVVNAANDHFGTIDYVVNNAGYALMGALEEVSTAEVAKNFNINVLGSLTVIRNVLPILRKNGSGHIINIASIGGFVGNFPGFGVYCATKFAVQGFTEALYEEVKPFGIHATAVSPGYFRTEFLSDDSLNSAKVELPEYENVRETVRMHEEEINGNQPGDPEKAATVFMELVKMKNPPMHLFLGSDAYKFAMQKMEDLKASMEENRKMATSTDIEQKV